jgi:hypothetical protein
MRRDDVEFATADGTTLRAGHVLVVGATDRRVRCVVAQVPTITSGRSGRRRCSSSRWTPTPSRRSTFCIHVMQNVEHVNVATS